MAEKLSKTSQAELRHLGLKVTEPRLRILELFSNASESSVRHLTAEDIYKQLIAENFEVGLATVYRVLAQFEGAGLIVRSHFGNGMATYEMESGEHHDHLVCVRCGKISEFVDSQIEKRQREIAREHGFSLQEHSLSLYGICSECQKKRA